MFLFPFWFFFKLFEEELLGQRVYTIFKVFDIFCQIAALPGNEFFL